MFTTNIFQVFLLCIIFPCSLQKPYEFEDSRSPILIDSSSSSSSSQKCNCIKLRDCKTVTDLMIKQKKPLSQWFLTYLRNSGCGFDDNDPLICCPKFLNDKYDTITPITTTTEMPWIWDIEKIPKKLSNEQDYDNFEYKINPRYSNDNDKIPTKFRFNDYNDDNNDYHLNLIDFEDPRTLKNCPPSFYDDDDDGGIDNRNYNFNGRNNKKPNPDKNLWGWKPYFEPPSFSEYFPFKNHHHHHNRKSQKKTTTTTTTTRPSFRRKTTPSSKINNSKKNLLNGPTCGISVGTRIIGGNDSAQGQFPWMARLAYRNRSSGRISYRCAGSVINNHYVITAAHCVTNLIESLELSTVRLGELNMDRDLDCNIDPVGCNVPQHYEIEKVIPHPAYDKPKYANDIALIRLSRTFNTTQITPICLPFGNFAKADENLTGKVAVVAGWGSSLMTRDRRNLTLKWVRLPIVNRTQCTKTYAEFSANSRTPIIVSSSQICAQGRENMDACQGDSGGPLMDEGTENSPGYTLLGLVSFGPRTCGVSNFPGVYTRVSSYINWILETIES